MTPSALNTIRQRRTVDLAALRPDPIPHETLLAVLEAANWAPSHGRTEPWRFAVFTGPGRARLSDALNATTRLLNPAVTEDACAAQRARQLLAPAWMAVAALPAVKPRMPLHEEQWATVCAIQNLLVAATELGLAGKWITNAASTHPHTARLLGFPDEAHPMGVVYLGVPAGPLPAGTRGPLADKVRWVTD